MTSLYHLGWLEAVGGAVSGWEGPDPDPHSTQIRQHVS